MARQRSSASGKRSDEMGDVSRTSGKFVSDGGHAEEKHMEPFGLHH